MVNMVITITPATLTISSSRFADTGVVISAAIFVVLRQNEIRASDHAYHFPIRDDGKPLVAGFLQ